MKPLHSNSRALCIWLPHWPLERARIAQAELNRGELLLYEEYRRGCFRVVACTGKPGITVGMSLAEAMALGATHTQKHDPLADRAALAELAAWCEQFSPTVGLEEPDNLLLDVTGLGLLFGGEESLAQQVIQAFHCRGLTTRVAIADTPGAAWAVAHYGKACPFIVPPGKTIEALADLPIAALRVPDATIQSLHELGIAHIRQLAAIPAAALASRFDPQLLMRLEQATGQIPEVILSHRPPPEIVAETQLEFSTYQRAALDRVLSDLIAQIASDLTQRQQGVVRLECQLHCESGQPIKLLVGLYRASADPGHLLQLARMQLDRLRLPGPVKAVKLAALTTARLASWQQELFDEKSQRECQRQLALLVDRLSNRLGRESAVRAKPLPDAQPEFAFHYEPLTGVSNKRGRESFTNRGKRLRSIRHSPAGYPLGALTCSSAHPDQLPTPGSQPHPRPLHLETDPIPLQVLSVVPSGPPIQFFFEAAWRRIQRAWGPERIQTAWWRGRYIQRDYYRIETNDGRRFWLFRRLADQKWFLHGAFD